MAKKILVIEDNEQNLYLITFLLESNGCEVIAAMNGLDGIELAKTAQPNLILLDIQLPGMHGYDVAKALRAIKDLDAVAIVAVTSHAMKGDKESCLAAGCDGYIEKPINPESFINQLSEFYSGIL